MKSDDTRDIKGAAREQLATSLLRHSEGLEALQQRIHGLTEPALDIQRAFDQIHQSLELDFAGMTGRFSGLSGLAGSFAEQIGAIDRNISRALPRAPILQAFAARATLPAVDWGPIINSMAPALERMRATQFVFDQHQSQIASLALMAGSHFEKLLPDSLGKLLYIHDEARANLLGVVAGLTRSYETVTAELAATSAGIGAVAPLVSRLPSIEYYNAALLARVVTDAGSTGSDDEELSTRVRGAADRDIEVLLQSLDPELLKMWRGARTALASSNPDRIRHFATSLRELWTHIVHAISPDVQIRKWSAQPEDFHDNRPKRRTRLRYICRHINQGPFTTFVEKDVAAALAFLDLFQEGTHAASPTYSRIQLDVMLQRMESMLVFLLTLHEESL